MRTRGVCLLVAALFTGGTGVAGGEHPGLAKARTLYNAADYDGAIAAAAAARSDPASADAAALVAARAHLERYRFRTNDPADLAAARDALRAIRAKGLVPRDRLHLLVGLGEALYLTDAFGAAAEIFHSALGRAPTLLSDRDRLLLLDWWASAADREAQTLSAEGRGLLLRRVMETMEAELREDPGSAPANYWLAVAARANGDLERAWHAAAAAWVRASLKPESTASLRGDIDRFVAAVLIPERARARPQREQPSALTDYRSQWEGFKENWK